MHKSELLMRLGVLFAGFPNAKPMDPALCVGSLRPSAVDHRDWAVINTLERFQRGGSKTSPSGFPGNLRPGV